MTRNADLYIEEDEADDLLMAMEEELRRRRFGNVVRLEVERSMPHETRALLQRGLEPGGLPTSTRSAACSTCAASTRSPSSTSPPSSRVPWSPVTPPQLQPRDEEDDDGVDIFARIRERDVLVHHPYESFVNSVQRFIQQAAGDPDVLTIKMTLYRTSGDSPIVHALIDAAESGKQVVVMVEIKARFDERANIVWARALERAGAHVAYGLLGLKTHSKCALVIRRETGGLRRYAHIGTGNYNSKTARIYTDLGLLHRGPRRSPPTSPTSSTSSPAWPARTATASSSWRRCPCARASRASSTPRSSGTRTHGDGRIVIKCNAVVDPDMIRRLYRASQAGRADRPHRPRHVLAAAGRPGLQRDRSRVRSIVGRYLEHSRIFSFGQGERERTFIGSADLMERNLDRRIEAMTPIKDPAAQARIREILVMMRRDDRRAWVLGDDGRWRRAEATIEGQPQVDTFEELMRAATEPSRETA